MNELTTLSRLEANTIQSFIAQVDFWLGQHGEKADKIEITYYPDDDGFEVVNNEQNNGVLKRNRATRFRTEILAWAMNMLNQLTNYDPSKEVKAFACVYKNGEFGVLAEVGDASEDSEELDSEDSEELGNKQDE
ncbi:hypothetical protein ACFBZI_07665 [Moraxella sp. ZJ142]|uniref:hypothetical protein n=1 Tax=Moraxella marmotae TaxID=3344520 RepID=UPI0035D525DD